MKKIYILILFLFISTTFLNAQKINEKRILYVNSYHTGLSWSDGIEKGIKTIINNSTIPIDLEIIEMDTKRNQSEVFKKEAALKVKKLIEEFKPDIVITSDDNAAKYLIVPYYYNSSIPFVFCGINGSAKKYNFPAKNITGMVEVMLVPQLLETLKKYTNNNRIGFLKGDSLSSRNEAQHFEKILNRKIDSRFVKTINEWKTQFIDVQKNIDILFIGNGISIPNWEKSKKEIKEFVNINTIVPTAGWDVVLQNIVLLIFANKPHEQGIWAAKTSLEILQGKDISKIKLTKNKKAKVYINVSLAKKLGIVFPFELIDNAVIVK